MEVVKINDRFGLIDNYPHIKAQRTAKARKPARADVATSSDDAAAATALTDLDDLLGTKAE